MRFVVLGPTGATGRLVVEQAAAAGHEVVAYARRPQAVPARSRVTVVGGAVDDGAALTEAMAGADAVICCLGPGRRPSSLISVDVLQRAAPAILTAMERADVPHLVIMSAFGVADTEAKAPLLLRLAYRTAVRQAFADKERIEPILADAPTAVTTVYPVILTSGPAKGAPVVKPVDEIDTVALWATVSRADVAAVLIELAEHPTGGNRRLFIG